MISELVKVARALTREIETSTASRSELVKVARALTREIDTSTVALVRVGAHYGRSQRPTGASPMGRKPG